jgi:hypothetical protein
MAGCYKKARATASALENGSKRPHVIYKGISNPDFVILSEAKNLLFRVSKKQILRPAASK